MLKNMIGIRSTLRIIHQLGGNLNPISSSWPFAQWGLDIVGPFLWATGNRRFAIVATDYLTKWVEAKSLSKYLRCRYGEICLEKYYHEVRDPRDIDFE